jgi:hypothetical protein
MSTQAKPAKPPVPPGMLVTVALLALYGAYDAWVAIQERAWLPGVVAVLAIVACVGTAMLRAWSRYLVYLLTAVFVGTWIQSLYEAAAAGYFSLLSARQIATSLAPGAFLALLSCACAWLVSRQFRARRLAA